MSTLQLHETTESDIENVMSIELANTQFILPNSNQEHKNLIASKDIKHIALKSKSQEIIGFAILAGLEDKNRSIEFRRLVIREKRKGFGRMAIKLVLQFCFQEINCHRLWLDVVETNKIARDLYRSEGFIEEVTMRDCVKINNKFESLVIMTMLEEEYRKAVG